MLWLAGDVKEPTRLSQRVGHEVPGVVVWPLLLSEGWGGKCSEISATIKLLCNPRVNKVFTFTFTFSVQSRINRSENRLCCRWSYDESAIQSKFNLWFVIYMYVQQSDCWHSRQSYTGSVIPSRKTAHCLLTNSNIQTTVAIGRQQSPFVHICPRTLSVPRSEQFSESFFAPNGDYCLYYPSNLFRNAFSDISQF